LKRFSKTLLIQQRQFFQPHNWKVAEFYSIWEEAYRLNRKVRLGWLLRLLMRFNAKYREIFRKMAGIVLLERQSKFLNFLRGY
jgi:hypothetical protein